MGNDFRHVGKCVGCKNFGKRRGEGGHRLGDDFEVDAGLNVAGVRGGVFTTFFLLFALSNGRSVLFVSEQRAPISEAFSRILCYTAVSTLCCLKPIMTDQ